MQLLFKILGLLFVFSACSLAGFSATVMLRRRSEKLSSVSHSVSRLAEYINADGGEIGLLAELCFDENDIKIVDGIPKLNKSFLKKEDITVIEEFLNDFGLNDRVGEYKRTKLYASLLERQREEVAKKSAELSKLYNTLGVLFGVGICIFLI